MQQSGVYDLLKMLEISLEEGLPIIPRKFTVVKTKEIETLIDRIYASLPVEVQEARAFLRRKDEYQQEAQQKAEKIISDAQAEADRKLSEADFIKALEKEGIRIRTQVQQECEEIKRKAMEEAENIRAQATEDAMRTKEGAELYAEQVLTNLVSNAIKFTPDGKSITISSRVVKADDIKINENFKDIIKNLTGDYVEVSVEDEGIGIESKNLLHAFDKFAQIENSLSRKAGGTGLGLPIAKQLLDAHKGAIWCDSELNKGSKFYFVIPVNKVPSLV